MARSDLVRRGFVRGTAVAATGAAAGLKPAYTVDAGRRGNKDPRKFLHYGETMESRRLRPDQPDGLVRVPWLTFLTTLKLLQE